MTRHGGRRADSWYWEIGHRHPTSLRCAWWQVPARGVTAAGRGAYRMHRIARRVYAVRRWCLTLNRAPILPCWPASHSASRQGLWPMLLFFRSTPRCRGTPAPCRFRFAVDFPRLANPHRKFPKNAMSARYVIERADWAGAAALPFTSSQYPQPDSLIRFTRGLGMARAMPG
jgi:hypothetical protein